MAKIYKNAAELVGNTPLLEVGSLSILTRQEVPKTVSP